MLFFVFSVVKINVMEFKELKHGHFAIINDVTVYQYTKILMAELLRDNHFFKCRNLLTIMLLIMPYVL